jgi:N6-adenosine-specific RNA methylase IME4
VWLATRGHGLPIVDHGVNQVIFAPRRSHSEKPDEFYERLERLFGDVRRLELFARRERPGWTVWGNQIDPQSRASGVLRAEPAIGDDRPTPRADTRHAAAARTGEAF